MQQVRAALCNVMLVVSLSLAALGAAHAQEVFVGTCDGCDATQRRAEAQSIAGGAASAHVYVLDRSAKAIEKYSVRNHIEPGSSTTTVRLVAIEPEHVEFVEQFYAVLEELKNGDVPAGVVPTLVDFLGNPAMRGDVQIWFQNHRAHQLFRFPANQSFVTTMVVNRLLDGQVGRKIQTTLRFADGGEVTVEFELGTDAVNGTALVTSMTIVGDVAVLEGVFVPTRQFPAGYDRTGSNHLLSELQRLAQLWGIQVAQACNLANERFTCDSSGKCTLTRHC